MCRRGEGLACLNTVPDVWGGWGATKKRNSLVCFSFSRPQRHRSHRSTTPKTHIIGRFQLFSSTAPQVARHGTNKKRNSLVCFSSSRPRRRRSHIATTTKKHNSLVGSVPLDHNAASHKSRIESTRPQPFGFDITEI